MTNLSFCCRFWVDWTTSWHVTLDSWEVVSVRASSALASCLWHLRPYAFPIRAAGEFLFLLRK